MQSIGKLSFKKPGLKITFQSLYLLRITRNNHAYHVINFFVIAVVDKIAFVAGPFIEGCFKLSFHKPPPTFVFDLIKTILLR